MNNNPLTEIVENTGIIECTMEDIITNDFIVVQIVCVDFVESDIGGVTVRLGTKSYNFILQDFLLVPTDMTPKVRNDQTVVDENGKVRYVSDISVAGYRGTRLDTYSGDEFKRDIGTMVIKNGIPKFLNW